MSLVLIYLTLSILLFILPSCKHKTSAITLNSNLPATSPLPDTDTIEKTQTKTPSASYSFAHLLTSKLIKDMTFDEALYAKKEYEEQQNSKLAMRCAERMIALGTNQDEVRKVMWELAQKHLQDGELEKAQKYANDYQLLFPGGPEVKDVAYLGIKAHFLATLSADRDQAKTQQTLKLAQAYLKKYTTDTQFTQSITDIIDSCYIKLLESELQVADCYIAQYNYTHKPTTLAAAHKRVSYAKEHILPHIADEIERIQAIELKLAQYELPKTISALEETAISSEQSTITLAQDPKVKSNSLKELPDSHEALSSTQV